MDVAFLAIRMPHIRLRQTLQVADSILAHSSSPVRFHCVADQRPVQLQAVLRAMHQKSVRWYAHSTLAAPRWAARLHRKLTARGCAGPVCDIYMHKLLLHLYLPRALHRVIFMDSDILVRSDISQLWQHFRSMRETTFIGIADEENGFEQQEPVVHRGGISSNGGVVLLKLHEMRHGGYTELLWRYANGDPSLPLNGRAGVGMAAEQVLYSWMSIDGTPGHSMIARIPCSWNVQLGSWPSAVSSEDARTPRRMCSTGCHVLHGAGGEGKEALGVLTRELDAGRSCALAFEAVRLRRHYSPGSASEALLLRVRDRCCV